RKFKLMVVNTVPKKLDLVISRGKDKIELGQRNGVVYKIDCINCDACYIGQTKQHLDTRIKEHRVDIKKHLSNHSVVNKHRLSNGHEFDWDNKNILHYETNYRKREIAEMFFIKKNLRSINLKRNTENLFEVYDVIVENTYC
ncbi:hypothetical protein X777_04820, partial [Ooceraea biroi]